MSTFSTRGLKTYILNFDAAGSSSPIQSISNADPAVIDPAGVEGQIVKIEGSDYAFLNGRAFMLGAAGILMGADASNESGAAGVGGNVISYDLSPGGDFSEFCINSLSRDVPAGDTISVATFCQPDAQVAGAPAGAGTLTWGGPIDFSDPGFLEMQKWLEFGGETIFVVEFPQNLGHLVAPVEINSYSESMELNAAATWSGGGVVKARPSYAIP